MIFTSTQDKKFSSFKRGHEVFHSTKKSPKGNSL